jgi:hypothetical protein
LIIADTTLLSQNITLAYKTLDLALVDRDGIRKLLPQAQAPVIMDMPEMIVAVLPDKALFVQVGERRVRITDQKPAPNPGQTPIWEVASRAARLFKGSKPALVAYGFNFDLMLFTIDGDFERYLLEHFIPQPGPLEAHLGGTITSTTPRVKYTRKDVTCELVLEPLGKTKLKSHINLHRDKRNLQLPSAEKLRQLYLADFDYFLTTTRALLTE